MNSTDIKTIAAAATTVRVGDETDGNGAAQTITFGPDLPTTFADAVRGLCRLQAVVRITTAAECWDCRLNGVTTDDELQAQGWQSTGGVAALVVTQRTNQDGVPQSRAVELVALDDVVHLHVY